MSPGASPPLRPRCSRPGIDNASCLVYPTRFIAQRLSEERVRGAKCKTRQEERRRDGRRNQPEDTSSRHPSCGGETTSVKVTSQKSAYILTFKIDLSFTQLKNFFFKNISVKICHLQNIFSSPLLLWRDGLSFGSLVTFQICRGFSLDDRSWNQGYTCCNKGSAADTL